jgi:Z1 domain
VPLDGEQLSSYLRVLRVHIDALHQALEQALESVVPAQHRDEVRARYEEETAQPIRLASVLSSTGGPKRWFGDWDPSSGYYWRRLREYLLDRLGRTALEVESLDDSTDKILSHLEDPRPSGPDRFQTRGLILGYVQSGKTANYSALITKAADVGYKFVIVLSGIDNGLRQQTQRRLEKELGLRRDEGVGEPEVGRRWLALTTSELSGDFHPGTMGHNVLQGNEHVLAVVKKNASVLRRLVAWMQDGIPERLPVLVVDDEADQASINTGGNRTPLDEGEPPPEEVDPSVINSLIRALLRSFQRVAYVAYTATPFANILINHEAIDREVFEDLYPRDFIVTLPKMPGYVGAERIFGRAPLPGENSEALEGLDIVRLVSESDLIQLVPPAREVESFEPVLCATLQNAFLDFILAIAARCQRAHGNHEPASMLIHTHHRTIIQNRMGELANNHITLLRQQWRYNREAIKPALETRWEREFRPVISSIDVTRDVPFSDLEEWIDRLFRERSIKVLVLNSDSEDVLDYEAEPDLKAVLIGGNRLSRGLTLEGLLVSYYIRRANAFDTLLQMGRWFGYRESHIDITRLWTTEELSELFSDVALAEEELRREAERYERERLTPLDFGIKIRAHPVMLLTAANKMGAARTIQQGYAGHLLQTTTFRLEDRSWLEENLAATRNFLASLGESERCNGRLIWSDVSWRAVDTFLGEYAIDSRSNFVDTNSVRQYIAKQVEQRELIRWRVAVIGQREAQSGLGTEELGGHPVNTIARTRLKDRPHSLGVLINPATADGAPGSGDEEIGLSDEQILQARTQAASGRYRNVGEALRAKRSKEEGLLLLYPISRTSRPRAGSTKRVALFDDPARDGSTVIGIALVFPVSDSAATIEYVVGSVGQFEPT